MIDPKTSDAIDVVEFPFQGLTVKPSPDQFKAWAASAGDQPVADWLAEVADDAAVRLAYTERTFPIVIELKQPVEYGSKRITQLSIRAGRLGDLNGVKLGGEVPINELMKIAARMAGEVTQVIERLGAADAGEVMSLALDFYGQCLGAGKTRSR